jgi:hypothetical protein
LCSADPEETPSAAKLAITRAAAEIESLRKRLLEAEALVADQHDQTSDPPILNPATGEQQRVRIDIPNGIEFEIAEIGSASTKATGIIGLDLNDSYGQFNTVRHSGTGVVHTRP